MGKLEYFKVRNLKNFRKPDYERWNTLDEMFKMTVVTLDELRDETTTAATVSATKADSKDASALIYLLCFDLFLNSS